MKGIVLHRPRFWARSRTWHPGKEVREHPWTEAVPLLVILTGVTLGGALAAWGVSREDPFFLAFAQAVLVQYGAGEGAVFRGSFLPSIGITALIALCGSSCAGAPLAGGILLLRGIAAGCVTAGLYGVFGLQGLAAGLVLRFVPTMLQFWALTGMTNSALSCSRALFLEQVMHRSCVPPSAVKLQQLGRRLTISGLWMLAAAALETLLAAVFAPVCLSLTSLQL